MSGPAVEHIASALLYEGYLLYPYRRSAVKNRQRFNFGVLYPEAHARGADGSDASEMRTECLLRVEADARLDINVRFLHPFVRAPERPGEADFLFETPPPLQERLGFGLILPELGIGDPVLDRLQLIGWTCGLKDSLEGRTRDGTAPDNGGRAHRGRVPQGLLFRTVR